MYLMLDVLAFIHIIVLPYFDVMCTITYGTIVCVSYTTGVMIQSQQFPIRYIVELLNKQCRIVITGMLSLLLMLCE